MDQPEKKPLDLCFGNPSFLMPYWDGVSLKRSPEYPPMDYQHECGLYPLRRAIQLLHASIRNVDNPFSYEVVVGNGATQILQAAVYALSRLGKDLDLVYAKPPFFQRFPRLVQMASTSVEWCHRDDPSSLDPSELIEIVTVPNNPDGDRSNGGLPFVSRKIHDLCYFWPQYGPVHPVSEDLMVFSLSKATGHASTRVGWALVKDPLVAKSMRDFIEHQTSDVSVDSQVRAFSVIEDQVEKLSTEDELDVFSYGTSVLKRRWAALEPILHLRGIEVPNRAGMFLWGRFENPGWGKALLAGQKVSYFDGEWFGLDDPTWFRMNIGCSEAEFKELVERLG